MLKLQGKTIVLVLRYCYAAVLNNSVKLICLHYRTKLKHLTTVSTANLSTGIKEDQQKIQAVKKLVQQLPPPNLDTMKVLFSHLLRYT